MVAKFVHVVTAAALAGAVQLAQAAAVASVSPQGEVALVRQVVVRFDQAVVPLGDPRQPDPMTVTCQGAAATGSGRWADGRNWLYDFREPLPPGTRCTVKLRADWRPSVAAAAASAAGPTPSPAITGRTEFSFNTGGPAVLRVQPGEGSEIEEDQHFLLHLTGAAVADSVARQAWCEVEGIGERIAVRVVAGPVRADLIKTLKLEKAAPRLLLLACQRPLPGDTPMRLVWGAGIAAQANPQLLTSTPQRFGFRVRKAFTAEFSCERERAAAPCLPIRPLAVNFSEPIARAQAQQVLLKPATGAALAPVFDKDDKSTEVSQVRFATPLPENARFSIELPKDVKDASGRPLSNAGAFPLQVATGAAPPMAKFATAPFGIIERNADAMLPVTLRHVQGDLRPATGTGQVRIKRIDSAADILAWLGKVRRFHESEISAREAGLPKSQWTETVPDQDARGRPIRRTVERRVGTREVSLLKTDAAAKRLDLPQLQGGDPRPFEVVGIPIGQPGYHVVEIESARLGAALLDKPAPLYVRTGVLVTNLGLHFKHGRENSLAWVTTLDRGMPVAGADVVVHDCQGKPLWSGTTDAQGLARIAQKLDSDARPCLAEEGLFVTASKADAKSPARSAPDTPAETPPDATFVFSSWQQGIEPWRFNVPTRSPSSADGSADMRAHTVFDRTLLRAGETVSMKHFIRRETLQGLAPLQAKDLPNQMKLVHDGSGQEFTQPLQWAGVRSATAAWNIPPAARLGRYRVVLQRQAVDAKDQREWDSGDFRVEEFRVPLVDARVVPPKEAPVAPQELSFGVQMSYLSGGAMAQAPLRGTALLRPRVPVWAGHEDFSFEPPRAGGPEAEAPEADDAEQGNARPGVLVADKQPLTTDSNGAARWQLTKLPGVTQPSELLAEITFNDPNGEVQTVATTLPLWPSAVVVGIRSTSWASARGQARFTALVLDTKGRALKGQAVEVRGRLATTISTRKRMVGGFYAYDNRTELQELGVLCSGKTDERGQLACDARLSAAGQVELIAQAKDSAGHTAQAAASVWVTQQGELWFAQDNDDRIDVLPEKKRYEPGETARLQVRMPFREATALVAVEREGVIETRVVTLRGSDPTIELPISKAWGPNVYVSVLAVRGRIRHVPWQSFFTWGWKEPINWARSFWFEGREYQAPTAMVDLSKPAFKLGVAALKVGLAAHELQVKVTTDQPQYTIRQKATARITVTQGGKPAAGAEVAFAAVDEGLLALRGNASWDLLNAMLQQRAWAVETSTAQGEIIGRRHYGRKAVAAGGGGGRGGTRELFDTLLLWQAIVALDANGQATVEVPLNDSLTSFRLVAVADGAITDAGPHTFGSGSTSIRVTQDLQVLSGLPPLVREGDQLQALLTLRNTTTRDMKVRATLAGTVNSGPGAAIERSTLTLPQQELMLSAGSAREVSWPLAVPERAFSIAWEAAVDEVGGQGGQGAAAPGAAQTPAKDRLKVLQLVKEAVPVRVLQATLQQLDAPFSLRVEAPSDALPQQGPKAGGLLVALQPRLSGALPGLRRYFETYPYNCLEQRASKALGLQDAAQWAAVANSLPTYLDTDGLANYYPPRAEDGPRGSDRLTAYVLAAAHEAGAEVPNAAREAMLQGLTAFVEGRLERRFWSPRPDLEVRKLAAIEALARHGRAHPRMLGSITIAPNQWPTAAVLDWLQILKRLNAVPQRDQRLAEANDILRARLAFAGTTMRFSTEAEDFWWWLMDSPDANASRLVLAVMDDPQWRADLPRLVVGSLARQKGGAWLTTTANLWGVLALNKFAAVFESAKLTGLTSASMGAAEAGAAAAAPTAIDWQAAPEGGRLLLPWPALSGSLTVRHQGNGKPWLTVQSLAAIALKAPLSAGYRVQRTVTAVEQKDKSKWSRGDVLRVRLEVDAQADMTWVVVSDPVPAGATILGSGLGRDSVISTTTERREGSAWPAFEERSFEAFRSTYNYLPRGKHVVEYTLRLNNPGRFGLPPTRVEAMYAPETFGEAPNAVLEVAP